MHGNVSSALFWQQQVLALAATGRHRTLAVDLRGYGDTDPLPIDATRGVRDWADDLGALIDALQLDRVHLVGWSMGAGVVLQYLLDAPERVASVALVAPVSPYGFGGTTGPEGQPRARRRHRERRRRGHPGLRRGAGGGRHHRRTARSGRARCCAPSTSRPARCHWTRSSRTSSSPSMNSTRPGPTTTRETRRLWTPGQVSRPAAAGCSTRWHRPSSTSRGSSTWPTSRRCCGSAGTPTRSSPTPRCSTWPSSARSAPSRLAWCRGVPAAADGHPDPLGARPVCRVRRRLPGGGAARRRAFAARRAPAGVRRRAARAPRRPRRGPANLT